MRISTASILGLALGPSARSASGGGLALGTSTRAVVETGATELALAPDVSPGTSVGLLGDKTSTTGALGSVGRALIGTAPG